jgi:hypothetical protein
MFLILAVLFEGLITKRTIATSARLGPSEWAWGTPIAHHTFEQASCLFTYKV